MKKILVIDDEIKIVEICRDYLLAAGYEVVTAYDGLQGLAAVRREQPDLVVLDLMMPGMDGLEVCRTLCREGSIPVIMLTARVEESDRLLGLEMGADDYITKPFSPRELVARVKTVLRRAHGGGEAAEFVPSRLPGEAEDDILRVGGLTLDRTRYQVLLPGAAGVLTEVILTPTEFELLYTLAAQPGRIFSRAQLLTAARGVAFESYERAIDSHIRNLRRKLELPGSAQEYIVTVHAVGYKFAG